MHPKSSQALTPLQAPAQSHQAPALTTRGGYKVTTPAGTDDLVVHFNNDEVLRITLGADMTIKTNGTLRLDAANIDLKCTNRLTVNANNGLDLKSGRDAALRARSNLTLNAGLDANVTAGCTATIRSNTVNIN